MGLPLVMLTVLCSENETALNVGFEDSGISCQDRVSILNSNMLKDMTSCKALKMYIQKTIYIEVIYRLHVCQTEINY